MDFFNPKFSVSRPVKRESVDSEKAKRGAMYDVWCAKVSKMLDAMESNGVLVMPKKDAA